MSCLECGQKLDAIDIGAYRKLMDRRAEDCLCRKCLAKSLRWTDDYMESVIRLHRERGCGLFPPLKDDEK